MLFRVVFQHGFAAEAMLFWQVQVCVDLITYGAGRVRPVVTQEMTVAKGALKTDIAGHYSFEPAFTGEIANIFHRIFFFPGQKFRPFFYPTKNAGSLDM